MRNQFIDVVKAFAELDSLFGRDSAVNGVLDHIKWSFAAFVNERRDIELFAGMGKDVFGDRPGGLSEHIRKHIIQFKIGHGKTVLRTVLLAGQRIRQFHAVTDKFAEIANGCRRDKGRFDHAAHEQVANPTGILAVSLVAFLGFGVLGMRKRHLAGFLKHIKYRNPILASGFHADVHTVVFMEPFSQLSQVLGEG